MKRNDLNAIITGKMCIRDSRKFHEDGGRDHVFCHSDLDLIRDSHMRDLS